MAFLAAVGFVVNLGATGWTFHGWSSCAIFEILLSNPQVYLPALHTCIRPWSYHRRLALFGVADTLVAPPVGRNCTVKLVVLPLFLSPAYALKCCFHFT